MAAGSFKTNPELLEELLRDCERGEIQLPDFQRSWVWDEERIRSLLASISQAFPVGALMTLETGGEVEFKPRPIQGAEKLATKKAASLLLDGQQRLTSLYQTAMRKAVVKTITARRKKVHRWYYIDIRKALDSNVEREQAIIGVPEDRIVRKNFGKDIDLDLSSRQNEFREMMFPVNCVFDWDEWKDGFGDYWIEQGEVEKRLLFKHFQEEVLENFKRYRVPVIALDKQTSKEAVCLVFEKVNTGGKPLDAFELVTAMYAAENFELRKDWYGEGDEEGRFTRLSRFKVLENVANTEFLQAVALLHTKEVRLNAEKAGKTGRELPQVSATRQSLLSLPLSAYKRYADAIERGYVTAAKFLHSLRIYRVFDLPYQSQLVPLAAIFADIGKKWEHDTNRRKIVQWYWNGVFGELYGSTVESRFAKDIVEVPAWLDDGAVPATITDATFRADRLKSMRMRISAAYKGVNALLMKRGAKDFRSGQDFDQTVFFNENVDIHHIFPRDWCKKQKLDAKMYDSIVNKTPLTARTNRIIGGVAPSEYLAKLENGTGSSPPMNGTHLDEYLRTHLIDPKLLRANQFMAFFNARQAELLRVIEEAMDKQAYRGDTTDEPEVDVEDDFAHDEAPMMAAAE